ncbi:MAG: hypothetical protein ACI4PR_03265 [Acutalibacteraceae bacterium]
MERENENYISELDRHIQKLKDDLRKKELEIEAVKEKIKSLLPVKIYTRKELKLMADKQKKKEDQKLNYIKTNIDLITLDALREADKLRSEAGPTEESKKSAEIKALAIEIQALERDIKIKSEIKEEKRRKAEEYMAQKVVSETRLKRLERKMKINHNIPSQQISEIKKEIFHLKNQISSMREKYFVSIRQTENIGLKLLNSERRLINRKTDFKSLTC